MDRFFTCLLFIFPAQTIPQQQHERKMLIRKMCNENKKLGVKSTEDGIDKNLIVDDAHRIIYCFIPKVMNAHVTQNSNAEPGNHNLLIDLVLKDCFTLFIPYFSFYFFIRQWVPLVDFFISSSGGLHQLEENHVYPEARKAVS